MFKKVIIATDLSPASYALIKCLGNLKPLGTEECLLLQCLSVQETASIALSYTASVLEDSLKKQKELLEGFGYKVETRIVPGVVKNEINRIALNENYSVIVTGAQKQSAASEAFFRGLAYDLIHHAKKPVLLLRLIESEDGATCSRALDLQGKSHIVFPTDFSENADHAFSYLTQIVESGPKKITLMHIQDQSKIAPYLLDRLEDFNEVDYQRLEKLKQVLLEKGAEDVDIQIKLGSPFKEIIDFANTSSAELIVMGSQGRGFVKELFLGSVSHNIARNADCSVLLIPAKRSKSD
ncbi:universal stress protein [Alkalibacter saccharofermentans]|uniref:Nucleotide-binding universal stress protein, UspA family n=1 Tax=Alkalibacter saccharofermentans DSM 14828 TaxID=1120975 RepID=A0A1M4YLC9_9FIRM|nr:universal stress protein [Alkalibacter saccharofermentans]SHF06554.1 Nucleotide-binding universal stress protein, UspA family [Alkalibacter saccharofermentans DSM 14828]